MKRDPNPVIQRHLVYREVVGTLNTDPGREVGIQSDLKLGQSEPSPGSGNRRGGGSLSRTQPPASREK